MTLIVSSKGHMTLTDKSKEKHKSCLFLCSLQTNATDRMFCIARFIQYQKIAPLEVVFIQHIKYTFTAFHKFPVFTITDIFHSPTLEVL